MFEFKLRSCLAAFVIMISLAGCQSRSPDLELSHYAGATYKYSLKINPSESFYNKTAVEQQIDSAKQWWLMSAPKPKPVSNDMQVFLNAKDPIHKIATDIDASVKKNLDWQKTTADKADIVISGGTTFWGVLSRFGRYKLHYTVNMTVGTPRMQDNSPLHLTCSYISDESYDFDIITTNKDTLTKELLNAGAYCGSELSAEIDKKAQRH